MDIVDRLLAEYAAAFKSGKTDPWPFLDQVDGDERRRLDEKMSDFLINVEPNRWDRAAFETSPAAALVDRLVPEMLVPEQGWRELLPSLRLRMKIKRETVTAELARALDAKGRVEGEKVADYYNDMEQGNLDPRGVSDRVLEALSDLYGTRVGVLRRAGGSTPLPQAGRVVFARGDDRNRGPGRSVGSGGGAGSFTGSEGRYPETADSSEVLRDRSFSRITGKPDRIDRLFVNIDGYDRGR